MTETVEIQKHHLVKVLPDQIARDWTLIRNSIFQSLAPTAAPTETSMSNILKALLSGAMICWYHHKNGRLAAVMTTVVMDDDFSGSKNLLVYSFFAMTNLEYEDYDYMWDILGRYGKAKGYYQLIAYTNDSRIGKIIARVAPEGAYTMYVKEF